MCKKLSYFSEAVYKEIIKFVHVELCLMNMN